MPSTLSDTLAVVRIAQDSLTIHDTMTVHDTLRQFLGRMPEVFRVEDTIGAKDLWSWGIQALGAVVAAYLGAMAGGRQARLASKEALHEEWRLDRRTDLERMRDRIQSNLQRFRVLAASTENHNPAERFDVTVADELEVLWNTYYRVSEPIFSLGNRDLSEALDDLFTRARRVGVEIAALERRAHEIDSRTQESAYFLNTLEERENFPTLRGAQVEMLRTLSSEASDLGLRLAEVDL